MGLCSSSKVNEEDVKYQTNNPAHEMTCPEGALRVQPGLNSLSKAVKEAKEMKTAVPSCTSEKWKEEKMQKSVFNISVGLVSLFSIDLDRQ